MAAPDTSEAGSLQSRLASVLPKDRRFDVFHLSTPPTKTDALYSAPPNERPDRTYCEKHFLAVSIDAPVGDSASKDELKTAPDSPSRRNVLVVAVEIYIYTTAHATTLFVAKADSTGYLNLLHLPKGTPSPIRGVCAVFISYLVEARRRKDVQFIVSLFARAQDQYLFPGSIKHSGKHVLDDRGLVKWWCRVLNPLLESPPRGDAAPWKNVGGYLVVPGLDRYETRAFIPRSGVSSSWTLGHPLERISHYHREFDWVPPRCLIPRFPDDPKSRFRDELDEEAATSGAMRTTGSWKSVRGLDTFWEMMAYRQECSSGRMTGFIWVVFDDLAREEDVPADPVLPTPNASFKEGAPATPQTPQTPHRQKNIPNLTPTTTPRKLFPSSKDKQQSEPDSQKPRKKSRKQKEKKKLRGVIIPRKPHIKTFQRNYLLDRPISTPYYYWPAVGRGERIVDETGYKRIVELLLHLDFATFDKAAGSTRRWVSEVGMGKAWALEVTGEMETVAPNGGTNHGAGGNVNNLSGLVKRKRTDSADQVAPEGNASKVNVLGSGLVKKKPKEQDNGPLANENAAPEVNVLGAGLIRKKPKA